MVSIAFYGGIPGGISTPIVSEGKDNNTHSDTLFQPYCFTKTGKGTEESETMAEGRKEDRKLKEEREEQEDGKRNDWWKIGMFMLCLLGTAGGILWWYEGQTHSHYIGLVAIGGRINGSNQTNAIECWGSFPGCRPFNNYFSYETNRTIHGYNESASLLETYHREITHMYRTSCVSSDHCQDYECKKVNINKTNEGTKIVGNTSQESWGSHWGFQWLECNQTENAKTILIPRDEMVQMNNNETWIPKGCNETWAKVKQCPIDMLYGLHPIRLCVQPPFFLVKTNNTEFTDDGTITNISNCGPQVFLGILEDNKVVVRGGQCNVSTWETGNFTSYNCTINNKTELKEWKLTKTSGITPLPISSESNTGLIRHKRDFGISALVAAIVAATAIAASATMSYIALSEVTKIHDVTNHTFEVENQTIRSIELVEKQIQILYAMILQTHADVQLLKEKQMVEETFNIVGCIEQTHIFCHTGKAWNHTWGHLNDSTEWDQWVSQMEQYDGDILTSLHAARNNLEQSIATFNTPDSIAQFGKNIWDHVANWIPGLGASLIKYVVLFVLVYVVLTSMPKFLKGLLTTMVGAGSSASRYLKKRYHRRHASREDSWDQDQYNIHLVEETAGLEDSLYSRKAFKNSWHGASEEYNKRLKSWMKSTKASGESYITRKGNMENFPHGMVTDAKNKDIGEKKLNLDALNLEIQSEGGSIYDCCIKAQEGTLAIPCCGFPLWLFWGLIIIIGRAIGYLLKGLAMGIQLLGKGLLIIVNGIKQVFDYFAKALNPPTSHISMPQYV
uniref:Envelope glycoprotein n=1 Tax=Equine infectious anemia virus TaxID=11665 RepID=A0A8A3BA76_9RETR|nr:env polyprotein [Equine infectious anemia virus]